LTAGGAAIHDLGPWPNLARPKGNFNEEQDGHGFGDDAKAQLVNDPNLHAGVPARAAAQAILSAVLRKRRPLDAAQDEVLAESNLAPRDAGFARAIAGETLRRFGQLDALLRECLKKPLAPHRTGPTLEILLTGACELLFLGVPAHAAVDAANRLAVQDSKAVHFKPLINATLRRLARDGRAMLDAQDAPRLNTPDWLWTRWCDAFGEETARAIAGAHTQPAPLDILTTQPLFDATRLPEATALPGGALRLADAGRVDILSGFADGDWWVQDFAAGLPARLLGDVRGKTVIDLCAAPGGKTAQLASMGAHVIAVERESSRIPRLKENLERLKLKVELIEADVRDYVPETRAPFVLLDASCSATGTIRRHPELPWIKSAADIMSCTQTAGELFDAAAAMVADGGTLVFAVCSLEREEGPEQVEDFLRRHAEFRRHPIGAADVFDHAEFVNWDGDLRTLPCYFADKGGMDGFYAARLKRL
jgi:16S rRNA (cytosine967-C5)-methyltransferase